MPPLTDTDDLIAYSQRCSPEALAHLVNRHIDFVYASALRQVKDPSLAEDVTQAVFIVLTRKAVSIRPGSLTGWLFNTTRHCAANARRAELRRRHHERQAAKPEVQMQLDDSAPASLDHALSRLRHGDRQVVLLRYLQQREFAEVGSILGISEQTARRRLGRAIERLRKLLSVGGQILPSAAIIQTLSSATTPAPAHLSAIVAAAASNITTTSTAAALATKTIHVMNWIKLKIAATLLLAAVVAGTSSIAAVKVIDAQSTVTANPTPPIVPVAAPAAGTPTAGAPATDVPTAGAVATFHDGMRVELIGVAPSPIEGQRWWKPDGSPLPQTPYRHSSGRVSWPGYNPYEFALRLTGVQPGWNTDVHLVGGGSNATSYPRRDILATVVAMPANLPATINFICATGPWQTRAVIPADAVFTTGYQFNGILFATGNDPKDSSITLSGTYSSVNALSNGDRGIVAVDLDGKVHGSGNVSTNSSIFTQTSNISFPHIRREQIKEFQIRTRPFNHTATFRNISLIPGQLTTPTVEQHETGAFVATFAGGETVEVVGITTWPPTGNWWQPDGSPLDQSPPDYGAYTGRDANDGEQAYAIAMKWIDPPASPDWFWTIPSVLVIGVHSTSLHVPPGSPDVYRFILPTSNTATDFRVALAAGPWRQWPTVIANSVAASVTVDNSEISFSPPSEQNGDTIIAVTDNLPNVQRQLIVIDKTGATHIIDPYDSGPRHNFHISHIGKAQIKSYQLQTRNYEYVNFKNLSLKPDQHSEVTIEPDAPTSPTAPPKPPGKEGL
jgi:RNA polymerase sigma factor (sigma-70 family)